MPRRIIRDSQSAILANAMDIVNEADGDHEEVSDGNSDEERDEGQDEGDDESNDEGLEDEDESDEELEDEDERDEENENAFDNFLSF